MHNGGPAAGIRWLADLVVPETLRLALTFFLERASGKTTVQISNLASVARMIARHWAHCDEQTMRQIVHLTSKVSTPRQRGLTEKNRARLRRFDDRRNLELILEATPGAYGVVQDVLGHRDAATTRNYYAGSETAAAARHFDAVIRQTRATLRGNRHRVA